MIFVTVGTHEQQFDRLVEYMDKWAGDNDEKVVIQTGYSRYEPGNCQWSRMYPCGKMSELTDEARIVISHGGPASFISSLRTGRIPVIVPRRVKFHEHVNDHQVRFCRELAARWGNIIVVEDINRLGDVIKGYDDITRNMKRVFTSNNENFCREFETIVENLR
ncbi:MAG: multidrug MFS transporter [Lachnospiraceae bacterium]|nr:multidrug MFS transporter [Lachnospiraceae bacterium]